jgi:hypothetical protein
VTSIRFCGTCPDPFRAFFYPVCAENTVLQGGVVDRGGMKQKIPEHRAVATFRDRFGSGNRVSFRAFLGFTSILYRISKKSSNSGVKKTGDQIANQRTG